MRGAADDEVDGPEVLRVRDDLPDPPVGRDTVLVRVHAVAGRRVRGEVVVPLR